MRAGSETYTLVFMNKTPTSKTETATTAYLAESRFIEAARACGSDAATEESAILSAGREFLPPCALVVLDGGDATDEYWDWLRGQTERAQEEHDAEYSGGHEWHGGAL